MFATTYTVRDRIVNVPTTKNRNAILERGTKLIERPGSLQLMVQAGNTSLGVLLMSRDTFNKFLAKRRVTKD
jgi:hypothetical protein